MYFTKSFFEKTFPEMLDAFGKVYPGTQFSVCITAFDREYVALGVVGIDDSSIAFFYKPSRTQKAEVLVEKDVATKQVYPMIAIPYVHIQSVHIGLSDTKDIGFKRDSPPARL